MTTDLAGARGTAAGDAHLRLRPTRGYEEKGGARSAHLEVLGDAFEPTGKKTEVMDGAEEERGRGDRPRRQVVSGLLASSCGRKRDVHMVRTACTIVQSRTTATRRPIAKLTGGQRASIAPMEAAAEERGGGKQLGFGEEAGRI